MEWDKGGKLGEPYSINSKIFLKRIKKVVRPHSQCVDSLPDLLLMQQHTHRCTEFGLCECVHLKGVILHVMFCNLIF